MKTPVHPVIVQVSVHVCEDGKTVAVDAYDQSGRCWCQWFTLPFPIDEVNVLDEWCDVALARPAEWRLLGGIG